MPNRDHDDSQYNRNEGRFEGRDEWRDVSNAGSREWDRRGDDFRQDRDYGSQRGYQPGSFEERREQRLAQQDFGRSGQDYRSSEIYRGADSRQGNYGQDWNRQQSGQSHYGQDASRQYGQGQYSQGQYDQSSYDQGQFRGPNAQYSQYGQSSYGQEWRGQGSNDWNRYQGAYGQGYDRQRSGSDYNRTQDWSRSQFGQDSDRNPSYRTDYSRSQSNYGGRDASRSDLGGWSSGQTYGQQSNYGSPYQSGQFREGREEESWGQQIRHAGQQAARSIKRAFRGPKNYRRSDERIREDVSDRLGVSDRLDPSEIEVSVSNGEVTLTGTVQSRGEKYLAEEIADDVSGVNEVNNQLRVRREDSTTTSSTTAGTGSTTSTTSSESTLRNRNARA